jgi:LPXTG-motif cell wall-anchored protein
MGGRALLTLATFGMFGALSAAPAAADVPIVSGTAAVGGTLVVTGEDNQSCDGQSASVALRRPIGGGSYVHITSGNDALIPGEPWTVSLTIPPTDAQGTPLTPGTQIAVHAGGVCNAFGDTFGFQYDEVLVTLGQPVTAPSTTTTTASSPTTVTSTTVTPTTVAQSPPSTSGTATVADPPPTTVVAAAVATPSATADATLPRTGASESTAALAGMLAIAVGAIVVLTASTRRRPPSTRRT